MLDRIRDLADSARDKWIRRDEIREGLAHDVRDAPARWRGSDLPTRLGIGAVVAICLCAIVLTVV